jgi:putative glycosyltransferase (TIGR04372 family)
MSDSKLDRVRQAHRLVMETQAQVEHDALIAAARALRQTGRPDEAQSALERAAETCGGWDWSMEQVLTLAALGKAKEAATATIKLTEHFEVPIQIRLIAAAAAHPGVFTGATVRKILTETCLTDDPQKILASFPLNAVGQIGMGVWHKTLAGTSFPLHMRLLARIIGLRIHSRLVDAAALILIGLVRVLVGGKRVLIASMGEFTRLADVVDRLDPVLRRLRDQRQEGGSSPILIVLYYGGYPNEELFAMYSEHCVFFLLQGRLIKALGARAFRLLQMAGRQCNLTVDYREIKDDFAARLPIIQFSKTRSRDLERELLQVGIDPERPIVCFGLRDLAYYQFYGQVMGVDTATVKRGDTWHRCPPLDSYVAVANHWAEQGHQVVRMGLRVSDTLPAKKHPGVIDYAVGTRSDALDAFLFSRCRFLLAGDTGLFSGAAAFDRPAVLSDLFLIRNTMYSSNKTTPNIFVPKLVFDHQENRFLSFSEWLYFNHLFSFAQDCENARFELIHNTAEDIIDATRELAERLEGRHETTHQDMELQERFRSLYSPYQVGYQSTALVSSRFLRKYSHLLN